MCGGIIIHQDKFLDNCTGIWYNIWRKNLIPMSLAIYSPIHKHMEVFASIVRDTGSSQNRPSSKLVVLRYATLLESLVSLSPDTTSTVMKVQTKFRFISKENIVTSCIYFHCFFAIQFYFVSVFVKPCERCLILLCKRSFDISRTFGARNDVVRCPNQNTFKIFFVPVAM